MDKIITYKNLEAWTLGMTLVEECYRATATFPAFERYGLGSQIRRAAVSIPSNLAEGACRPTTPAYANHVGIALGSHGELETCIEISGRLAFLRNDQKMQLLATAASVGRLLNGLYRSLEHKMQRT
jgi:four helix bundle protein